MITLQEGGNTPVEYTVTLPAHEWTAGSNCIDTFSAGRNKLTVMDVTVGRLGGRRTTGYFIVIH